MELLPTAWNWLDWRIIPTGLASAPGWRTSPFGTKPGAFLFRTADRDLLRFGARRILNGPRFALSIGAGVDA